MNRVTHGAVGRGRGATTMSSLQYRCITSLILLHLLVCDPVSLIVRVCSEGASTNKCCACKRFCVSGTRRGRVQTLTLAPSPRPLLTPVSFPTCDVKVNRGCFGRSRLINHGGTACSVAAWQVEVVRKCHCHACCMLLWPMSEW